jgi:hypothetical protein
VNPGGHRSAPPAPSRKGRFDAGLLVNQCDRPLRSWQQFSLLSGTSSCRSVYFFMFPKHRPSQRRDRTLRPCTPTNPRPRISPFSSIWRSGVADIPTTGCAGRFRPKRETAARRPRTTAARRSFIVFLPSISSRSDRNCLSPHSTTGNPSSWARLEYESNPVWRADPRHRAQPPPAPPPNGDASRPPSARNRSPPRVRIQYAALHPRLSFSQS